MEEKKKPGRIPELMTPTQIAEIKAEIQDIKNMRDSADETKKGDVGYFQHSGKHIVDVNDVNKAILARERQLRKHSPKKLEGAEANKAFDYAKKLKRWITENMPRETFVTYPRDKDSTSKVHDFEKAVEAQVMWQQKGQRYIQYYHYLMQRIDPNAPREDFNKLTRERA